MSEFDKLAEEIRKAGAYAKDQQKHLTSAFKQDGSIVTNADLEISHHIIKTIGELYPGAGRISEEEDCPRDEGAELTFVLDPIDGTDVYSQGLPAFAVALGILDKDHRPVGAIIDAPRFGVGEDELFITMRPGQKPLLNGRPIAPAPGKDEIRQVAMSSTTCRRFDFSTFRGKSRIFGSTILHLLSPAVFSGIQGALAFSCYIWDVLAAHAVLEGVGMRVVYSDGSPLTYDQDLLMKKPLKGVVYAGTEKGTDYLRAHLPLK